MQDDDITYGYDNNSNNNHYYQNNHLNNFNNNVPNIMDSVHPSHLTMMSPQIQKSSHAVCVCVFFWLLVFLFCLNSITFVCLFVSWYEVFSFSG